MRELAREFVCLKDVISDWSSGIHPLSIGLIPHTDDEGSVDQDSESSKSSKKPLKAKSQCRPESKVHQKDDEDDRDGQKDPKPRHFASGKDAHSPTYHGSDKAKTDDDLYGSSINPTSNHDADASIQSFDSAVFGLGGSIPNPKKPEMEYFPELDILHEALQGWEAPNLPSAPAIVDTVPNLAKGVPPSFAAHSPLLLDAPVAFNPGLALEPILVS
jgi:hypothetical protein